MSEIIHCESCDAGLIHPESRIQGMCRVCRDGYDTGRLTARIAKAAPAPAQPAPNDPVQHPAHYTGHKSGIECIEVTRHFGFCLGNVIKYVWRADLKGNATEDLCKARAYLDFEIETRIARKAGK